MAREGTEILFIDENYRKDSDVELDLSAYTPAEQTNALLPSKYLISFTSQELAEEPIGAQIVIGVNPGPALDVRDGQGFTRYQKIQQALGLWAQARGQARPRTCSVAAPSCPAFAWPLPRPSFSPAAAWTSTATRCNCSIPAGPRAAPNRRPTSAP